MNKMSGLEILITYHKITGITYWGSTIDGNQTVLSNDYFRYYGI